MAAEWIPEGTTLRKNVRAGKAHWRRVILTDGSVLDNGRAGAKWAEATGGGYTTNRNRIALARSMD